MKQTLLGCVCATIVFATSIHERVTLAAPPDPLRIATWNVEWLYDNDKSDNQSSLAKEKSAPSAAEWNWKKKHVAQAIASLRPDILALQEVENRRVLLDVCDLLRTQHELKYRVAFINGTDTFTEQDVAILYRSGLVEFSRREQTRKMFDSGRYYNVSKHLFARFQWDDVELTMATAHLRASQRGAAARAKQARLLRSWLEEPIAQQQNVVVLGDFNASESFDRAPPRGEISVLRGLLTESTADDLIDLHRFLPADKSSTHLAGKQFDRILVSSSLTGRGQKGYRFDSVRVYESLVVRGRKRDENHYDNYYDIEQDERDSSDHYPVMAVFRRSSPERHGR